MKSEIWQLKTYSDHKTDTMSNTVLSISAICQFPLLVIFVSINSLRPLDLHLLSTFNNVDWKNIAPWGSVSNRKFEFFFFLLILLNEALLQWGIFNYLQDFFFFHFSSFTSFLFSRWYWISINFPIFSNLPPGGKTITFIISVNVLT